MTDIFISYKKEDVDRVTPIAEALARAGYDVWWDHRIPPGRTYRDVIGAALASAKCVIVVWSKLSANAQWVLDEADEGKRRNVLLPILIDDVEPPYGFRQIEAARLMGWTGDTDHSEWLGALSTVAHFVGREAGGPAKSLGMPSFQTSHEPAVGAPMPARTRSSMAGLVITLGLIGALCAAGLFAWRTGVFDGAPATPEQVVLSDATNAEGARAPEAAEPAAPSAPALVEQPAVGSEVAARPREVAAAPACFWLEPGQSRTWRRMSQHATIEQCFAQDSCNGGLGHSRGGCYKWANGPDAQRYAWPAPRVTYACYWLSNQTDAWQAMSHLATIEQCREQDSCNGGLGLSRGGCYKWAAGPEAPREPWR